MNEIRFYRASEKPFGVFSNLFKRDIEFEDEIYPTAEHAYQAGKPRKQNVREWILAAPTPALQPWLLTGCTLGTFGQIGQKSSFHG